MLLITIIILILALLASIYLSRIITKPLIQLRDRTQEISKGNIDTKITFKSKDEIGDLASAFNKMVVDIKKSRDKIEEYSKTLEQKVEQRTIDLDDKIKKLEENELATLNIMEDLQTTINSLTKADKEILLLKEYNERILESNPNPIVVIKGNKIEYVNNSFIPYFGETKKDIIFKNLNEIMPSETIPVFDELMNYFNRSKELEIKEKIFSANSFVIEKTKTEAEEEEEVRIGIVLQDITERKKAVEALQKKTHDLERFVNLAVGREQKMIELKKKIKKLESKIKYQN